MTMTRRREIEIKAQKIISEVGITEPPIPIELIVEHHGAQIARRRFEGFESGFAISQGDQRIIGVNTDTTPRRQRFTIAHELGHLLLHHKPLNVDHSILVSRRDDVSSLGTDQEEIDANAFAAAILMPANMVASEIEKEFPAYGRPSRKILIAKLARTFNVSDEAMAYRLVNLNLITGWI
jgi:Zn-dependent peptidase ImmA (M78 family)